MQEASSTCIHGLPVLYLGTEDGSPAESLLCIAKLTTALLSLVKVLDYRHSSQHLAIMLSLSTVRVRLPQSRVAFGSFLSLYLENKLLTYSKTCSCWA